MEHNIKKEADQPQKPAVNKELLTKTASNRRTVIKALAGIPVLGIFAYEFFKKQMYDRQQETSLLKELGLEEIRIPGKTNTDSSDDLLRIGIIGFGNRAKQLARGLGFMHPSEAEQRKKRGTLENWLAQDDLNVAVTGICDVFDLHAQKGIETVNNRLQSGELKKNAFPVKRYLHYREMLEDKEIDAVIIATPDHHHAPIVIDAAKAGKHIYCEKSPCHKEAELFEMYHVVKNSNVVYQLGHQITQNAVFQQAKEIIRKNILGKITLIETTTNRNTSSGAWIRDRDAKGKPKPGDEKSIDWQQWLGNAPKVPFSLDRFYNWTKWFDYDLGMLGQLFTHEYDAVNQLLGIGIPKSAVASGGIYYWKDNREIPDTLHAVFEYPDRDLTLLYSASLASSRQRGRVFMGHDASMELGNSVQIKADTNSTRYKKLIADGMIDPSISMLSLNAGSSEIDAVSSSTEKYYVSRGLTSTFIKGKMIDLAHLHLKEWIDCIRNGGTPTANIDRAFEEGVTCLMAHKSYIEKRKVEWDYVNKRIV